MRARFWGTRGSLPVALTASQVQHKVALALLAAEGRRFESLAEAQSFAASLPFASARTYGGNSSCVEIEINAPTPASHDYVICDLGSGLRVFGNAVMARHGPRVPNIFHVFLSHLHWDHIMGFPFFAPAYIPGNRIVIHSCHANAEMALRRQQAEPSFPVEFAALGASIEFVTLEPGVTTEIAGLSVTPQLQLHGGDSYGYRFERAGKVLVYSTDSEHRLDNAEETEAVAQFFRNADLVIFDAMYSLADSVSVKQDWGHSSNVVGVELCHLAGATRLALFHHEPIFSDERIAAIEAETCRLEHITRDGAPPLDVIAAYDGLEIDL